MSRLLDGWFVTDEHTPFVIMNGAMYEVKEDVVPDNLQPGYYNTEFEPVEGVQGTDADPLFEEHEHPRDPAGKFADKPGSGKKKYAAGEKGPGAEFFQKLENVTNYITKGNGTERVHMRNALKNKYGEHQHALRMKILESFGRQYALTIKSDKTVANKIQARAKETAAKWGLPDPTAPKSEAGANFGYSAQTIASAKEIMAEKAAAPPPVSMPPPPLSTSTLPPKPASTNFSPEEIKGFNDLVALAGALDAKLYSKRARNLVEGGKGQGLSVPELAHIIAYSGAEYRKSNTALRAGVMTQAQWQHVAELNRVLSKLPDHKGTVYRRADIPVDTLKNYQKDMIIEERAFTSTSKSSTKWSGQYVFTIRSETGKDISRISSHPGEEEVLFRSGTRFKVTNFDAVKRRIDMEEVGRV